MTNLLALKKTNHYYQNMGGNMAVEEFAMEAE